jgi:hypothetical protein
MIDAKMSFRYAIALALILPLNLPCAAQTTPDILGRYVGTGSEQDTQCRSSIDNRITALSTAYNITSQWRIDAKSDGFSGKFESVNFASGGGASSGQIVGTIDSTGAASGKLTIWDQYAWNGQFSAGHSR